MAVRPEPQSAITQTCSRGAVLAVIVLVFLLAAAMMGGNVRAQVLEDDLPILFTADEVGYDRERRVVTATGNIEASYEDRSLVADRMTYNQVTNLLVVEGNIALIEPSGEVLFADRMELTGDLESGMMENIRALLSDGARFAANGARRSSGNRTQMSRAVYSPCNLCPDEPTSPPLWQIKAREVLHDQEQKRIEYFDAVFELGGVPVLYTPFISHPDPTVKRKTGFLIPAFGNSSTLGFIFGQPFYWVIDDDKDMTITPIVTTKEGPVLALEYRQALPNGTLNMDGSGTINSDGDGRGHIFSELRHEFNDTWRMGVDFNRTTDDTYLRLYRISNTQSLTSQAFVEGFRGRNYVLGGAYAFQNLDDDQVEQEPLVLPLVDYYHESDPDRFGGHWNLRLNAAAVTREDGPDSRRLSARGGWEIPLKDSFGSIYQFTAALWADGYQVQQQPIPNRDSTFTGLTGRIFPQAALQWRFPLLRDGERIDQIVQPIVEVVVAPNGGNPEEIPNEDSRAVQLDVSNVFGLNRFPGLDRVESGTRVNYGLQWQLFDRGAGRATFFAGQVYRLTESRTLDAATGLSGNLSNLVAGAQIDFSPYVQLRYGGAYDVRNARFRRNEVRLTAGVEAIRLSGSYIFLRDDPEGDFQSREEIEGTITAQLSRYWRARVFGTGDLASGAGLLRAGTGLAYEDECFIVDATWTRENFRDRDVEPSDTFFIRVALKTLGDLGFGF